MLECVGHPVIVLRRVGINGLKLKGLKTGEIRYLTLYELKLIQKETGQKKQGYHSNN
jgi:16S rRNA U516 pseudouridylate synthase RsuA-like enzyme